VFEMFVEGVKEQAAPAILSFEQRRAAA